MGYGSKNEVVSLDDVKQAVVWSQLQGKKKETKSKKKTVKETIECGLEDVKQALLGHNCKVKKEKRKKSQKKQ